MKPIALALLFTAFAGEATAQVDPLNWCPEGPFVVAPPMSGSTVERAVSVVGGQIEVTQRFSPAQQVGVLELRALPPRQVSSSREGLGLREGAQLHPFWIVGDVGDVLNQRLFGYCGETGEVVRSAGGRSERVGVCLSEINESNVARSASHLRFSGSADELPTRGRTAVQSGLGRNQDWAVLSAPAPVAEPSFFRPLRLGRIEVVRQPSVGSRPAYNRLQIQFGVEGYPAFTRALGDPLRIDGGWLVVTDFAADGTIALTRMSDAEWTGCRQSKCPL